MTVPVIDFDEGTVLTHHVVEAMRLTGARLVLYASGSGVYGDLGELEAYEDYGPMIPVSTYGASKLAGEALISSYCAMFSLSGCAFRFGNVVGPRQTHGVGFDFVRQLAVDRSLTIFGDGSQSKSYIHVMTSSLPCSWPPSCADGPFRSSTWPPATTSRCERLPSWRWRPSVGTGDDRIHLHGRRSRVEGRRPDRPAQHRPYSRLWDGRMPDETRRRCRPPRLHAGGLPSRTVRLMSTAAPAVFLDRDGVLNHAPSRMGSRAPPVR